MVLNPLAILPIPKPCLSQALPTNLQVGPSDGVGNFTQFCLAQFYSQPVLSINTLLVLIGKQVTSQGTWNLSCLKGSCCFDN